MRERAGERASKYLETMTQSLEQLKAKRSETTISVSKLDRVLELVRDYTQDAKHYAENQKPVTSLGCIAYAEGLLDALKFLQLVDF